MLDKLKTFLGRLRRRWFPTKDERYADGKEFAEGHFGRAETEDELDMLYDWLPISLDNPFDIAINDVYFEKSRFMRLLEETASKGPH